MFSFYACRHVLCMDVPRNGSDSGRNIILLKLVRTQQNGVGVGGLVVTGSDVVAVLLESSQTNGRDLVESLDLVLSLFVVVEVTVGLPFSTSVFDFDVAGHASGSSSSAVHEGVGNASAVAGELIQGKSGGNHDVVCLFVC